MRRLGRRRLESVTVAVGLMTFDDVGPTLVRRNEKAGTSPWLNDVGPTLDRHIKKKRKLATVGIKCWANVTPIDKNTLSQPYYIRWADVYPTVAFYLYHVLQPQFDLVRSHLGKFWLLQSNLVSNYILHIVKFIMLFVTN